MADDFGSLAPWIDGLPVDPEQLAVEQAAEAAAARIRAQRRSTAQIHPIGLKVLDALGRIPERMAGAAAGMIDASKQVAAEQYGAGGEPLSLSTDYDPRRLATQLGAETALNTFGVNSIGAGIPSATAELVGGLGAMGRRRNFMLDNEALLRQQALDRRNEGGGGTVR